jgi:cytochrome P450
MLDGEKASVPRGNILETMRECSKEKFLLILVHANADPDLEQKDKLTDEELLGQILHLLWVINKVSCLSGSAAGSETSSNTTQWALWRLAHNPHIQDRLRQECLALSTDDMPM